MTPPSPWQRWARRLVIVLAALMLASFAAGIVVRVQGLQRPCLEPPDVCTAAHLLTTAQLDQLAAAGISPAEHAALQAAKWMFFTSIWVAVGALIVARRPDEWVALTAGGWLMTFPTSWDGLIVGLAAVYPLLAGPLNALQAVVNLGLLIFVLTFPNGRVAPPWSLWVAVVWMITIWFLPSLPPAWRPVGVDWPTATLALNVLWLIGLVVAQIVRYWRYSTAAERDRTRWVIFGLSLATVGIVIIIGVSLLFPTAAPAGPLAQFTSEILYQLIVALIPVSIGIAILRSRLWDIDVIIRRTLVYAVLSGVLALLYFGSVVVFESLLRGLTGGGSQAAIVLSTLLIAALFGPLRARVQRVIDQRFYRRKYDAARTLAAFGASVRDNVDLDALGQRLTAAVDETMQPAHISLWAPAPGRRGRTHE